MRYASFIILWNDVGSEVRDCFVVALLAMTVGCWFLYEMPCDGVKGLLRCCPLRNAVGGWFPYETLCDGVGGASLLYSLH